MIISCFVLLNACKKNEDKKPVDTKPAITYINLSDTTVAFNRFASFDLNGDGEKDVAFGTRLVGDPITQQDKKQWLVVSSFNTCMPVNSLESIPLMNLSDKIPVGNFNNYNWYNASGVVLVQKIITNETNFWEGDWKDATNKFIPVQINKGTSKFNGWFEVSFSKVDEKIILHKAAISKEPNKEIQIAY